MTRTEIPVLTVEVEADALIRKTADRHMPYMVPVTLVLEDGQRIRKGERFRLLRDAKSFVAAGSHAPTWATDAVFDEDGRLYAISVQIFVKREAA